MVQRNYELQYKNLDEKIIKYAGNSAHFIMFDKFDWFINEVSNFIKL